MGDLYPEGTWQRPSGPRLGYLEREKVGLAVRREVQGKTPGRWGSDWDL